MKQFGFGGEKIEIEAKAFSAGYGFDFGSQRRISIQKEAEEDYLFADEPFYFSVKVPEGNYKVTISYCSLPDREYQSTVRSESRQITSGTYISSQSISIIKEFYGACKKSDDQ